MFNYAIWNKQDDIVTVTGNVYTAQEWMDKYPIAKLDSITVLCAKGVFNGAIFDTLEGLVERYEAMGCDFGLCVTAQDKLERAEAFEIERAELQAQAEAEAKAERENVLLNEEISAMALASIAASLEYQNMMSLEDVEVQ